ncbi:MAG: hypothetical protein A3D74_00420 [Candidatus Levybacteria bacterium RIFCSPHIGHO2_02_FULL_37_13]|nr:MAG: hypothetical protein A3D74_00420 [Candidatus Levybacteria bacterium RIFCSPHIGHO2_02_FULL_37_13]OGH37389.1 MAG: hypothetical protein A3B41_03235 [Candidatus Levybacteria bacterium RIFCSPLOWO2_01_FULL_37_26]
MVVERRGQYTPEQQALSNLPRLVEQSVRDTQDLQRQLTGFKPGMDLINWHKRTDRYRYVYGETQRFKRDVRRSRDKTSLRHNLAGIVFQDIAYSVCALDCDDSRVLLSPEKTSEFWTMLYPNKEIVSHPYGQETLENAYVPDGILVNTSKAFNIYKRPVFKLYEYSLVHMTERDLEEQLKAIRIQHEKFPGLFAETSVEFVIPRTFPLPRLSSEEKKVEFLQLPITRVQFGHFITDLYNGMR